MKRRSAPQANSVFLNLPFERKYEPVFVGFIVGLTSLGLVPRSVLELNEDGDGRMQRLFRLMQQCSASIHDLSYGGNERRYNMPFELGVAYAIARYEKNRTLIVCEAKKRDLLKILTDLRHFDPKMHGMDGYKALGLVYDCFLSPSLGNSEKIGTAIYGSITKNISRFRGTHPTIFNRRSFVSLVYVTSRMREHLMTRTEP